MKRGVFAAAVISLTISIGQAATAQHTGQGRAQALMSRAKTIPTRNPKTALTDERKDLLRMRASEVAKGAPGALTGLLFGGDRALSDVTGGPGDDNSSVAAERSESAAGVYERSSPAIGVGSKPARGITTGVTLNSPGALQASVGTAVAAAVVTSQVYAVSKWSNDLDALLDAAGVSGTYTVLVNANCMISAGRTTGPGVSYQFKPGCKISGAGTATLTIGSPSNVIADARQQVFGSGVIIRFTGPGTAYPGWWGATGNGSTDETAMIQAAIDAIGNGTVLLPTGTYIVDDLRADRGTILKGQAGATLKLKNHATGSILRIAEQNTISIENVTFDMNGANQGSPAVPVTKRGIYAAPVSNLQITGCRFINLFEYAIEIHQGSYVSIEDCYFSGKAEGNPTEWALKDIHATSCAHLTVQGCAFDHVVPVDPSHGVVGIYLSAVSQSTIDNNLLRRCGADDAGLHQGAAIDLYNNNHDIAMTNNVLEECNYMGCRISRCSDIRFEGNTVKIPDTGYQCAVMIYGGAAVGADRIWITDNVLKTAPNDGEGVYVVASGVAGEEPNEIYVLNNTIEGWYGIWARRGCHDLLVSGNSIATRYCGIRLEGGTTSTLRGVTVAHNQLDMSRNVNQYALGVVGEDVEIYDNTITAAYRGMSLRIPSGGQVHDNTIDARSYHFLLYKECQNLFLDDNQLIGTGPKYYKEGGQLVFYDSR